jgi:hypothetical protein
MFGLYGSQRQCWLLFGHKRHGNGHTGRQTLDNTSYTYTALEKIWNEDVLLDLLGIVGASKNGLEDESGRFNGTYVCTRT